MREIILLPDETFFMNLYKININLNLLDEIENDIGKFAINDQFYKNLNKYIKQSQNAINHILWKSNLTKYYDKFYQILGYISSNNNITINSIQQDILYYTKIIYKIIKQFNNGVSIYDASLYGFARYIRTESQFEPMIISDDLDINLHGNFISSYFGLNLIQVSSYEILRMFNSYNIISDYLKELDLEELNIYNISDSLKKRDYEPDIKKLFSKSMLSLNPKIEKESDYKKVLKSK